MHDNYIKAPTVLRALMREKKRERKKRVGWSCTWIGTVHGSRPGCRDKTDLQLCFIFSLFSRLFVFGTLVFSVYAMRTKIIMTCSAYIFRN